MTQAATLYTTKQTPRGSVVVLGDKLISEQEEPRPGRAQLTADWLNFLFCGGKKPNERAAPLECC